MGLEVVITLVAGALLNELVGHAGQAIKERKEVRKALELAVARGLGTYLAGAPPPDVARALERQELWRSEVVSSLRRALTGAGPEPEARVVAAAWATVLGPAARTEDLVVEAERLLGDIRAEVRASPVLCNLVDGRTLEEIAVHSKATADLLRSALTRLDVMASLDHGPLRSVMATLEQGSPEVRELVQQGQRDWVTKAMPSDVVMRQWAFELVRKFVTHAESGYLLVRGEPGIGKSTLAAQLTTELCAVLHFNSRLEGPRDALSFRRNVGAQLVLRHGLEKTLNAAALEEGGLLNELLRTAGEQSDEPVLIVVDALDEARQAAPGGSPLGLPAQLPPNVYIVATARPHIEPWWTQAGTGDELDLGKSPRNRSDTRTFVWNRVRTGVGDDLARRSNTTRRGLVERIAKLSEGNFMYLRHVLHDLESGHGIPARVDELPHGLQNYYAAHVDQLGLADMPAETLVAFYALALVGRPTTVTRLASIARRSPLEVQKDLERWREFLDVDRPGDDSVYTLYHAAFAEFLLNTNIMRVVRDEIPDLRERIADEALGLLYGRDGRG